MHILTSSDDNYIQHLAVMLVSLLENTPSSKFQEIAVINDCISEANIEKLKASLFKYSVPIRFVKNDRRGLIHLKPKNNKTLAAFDRIFLSKFYSLIN